MLKIVNKIINQMRKKLPKFSLSTKKINNQKEQSSQVKQPQFQQYLYNNKSKPKNIDSKYKKSELSNNHIQTLKLIQKYRQKYQAPVDTMGCQKLFDTDVPQLTQKYQILMGLLLSVQTKDQITSQTILTMKKMNILTPQIISTKTPEEIQAIIKKTNFHKKKAKNMIQIAKIFLKEGLPKNLQELLEYPGVGIKIATLYFKVAENIVNGIGVDTHVHRICNRLGWVKTDLPQKTQQQLQKLFPKVYWNQINEVLVGFGQILCSAKNPKCKDCPVSDVCPSSNIKK